MGNDRGGDIASVVVLEWAVQYVTRTHSEADSQRRQVSDVDGWTDRWRGWVESARMAALVLAVWNGRPAGLRSKDERGSPAWVRAISAGLRPPLCFVFALFSPNTPGRAYLLASLLKMPWAGLVDIPCCPSIGIVIFIFNYRDQLQSCRAT